MQILAVIIKEYNIKFMNRKSLFLAAILGLPNTMPGYGQAIQPPSAQLRPAPLELSPDNPRCNRTIGVLQQELLSIDGAYIIGAGLNSKERSIAILGYQNPNDEADNSFTIIGETNQGIVCMMFVGKSWNTQTGSTMIDAYEDPNRMLCRARANTMIAQMAFGYDLIATGNVYNRLKLDMYVHPDTHDWLITTTRMISPTACLHNTSQALVGRGWSVPDMSLTAEVTRQAESQPEPMLTR